MKRARILLSLLLALVCMLTACSGGVTETPTGISPDTQTEPGTLPDEAPTEPPATEIPTDAPTEALTEPATEPPALCTLTFVNTVWENVPPVTLPAGTALARSDIQLAEDVTFMNGDTVVYPVPAGETFDGDFSHYKAVKLNDYIVTEDAVLALDLDLDTRDLTGLADTSVINYYGRNHVEDDKVTFLNTASGFEVRFYGTTLTASFTRRGAGAYGGPAVSQPTLLRVRVYGDGDMSIQNSHVVTFDASNDRQPVVLAEFADFGFHMVLVRKMNYDFWGYLEMTSLSADGGFCSAPAKPEKKILVYGDSITVGFGVEYNAVGDVGGDVPEKEDGTVTYSALFADHFGAQLVEYANSGVSIGIPCWRDHVIMKENYWQQYAYFDTGSEYDMTEYVPDLIICNLGTNDYGGLVNGASNFGNGCGGVPNDFYKPADLEAAYADFIATMKNLYPDAVIIMTYGMMGTGAPVTQALNNAVRCCGFDDVYYLNFKQVECSQNAGHPTISGQADAYNQLLKFMDRKHITF